MDGMMQEFLVARREDGPSMSFGQKRLRSKPQQQYNGSLSTSSISSLLVIGAFKAVTLAIVVLRTAADPLSRPYIPHRTSPFDQPNLAKNITWSTLPPATSTVRHFTQPSDQQQQQQKQQQGGGGDSNCPLSFHLGLSHRTHGASTTSRGGSTGGGAGIHAPPITFPVHISSSSSKGRDIIYTTDYEHLDLLTPSLPSSGNLYSSSASSASIVQELVQEDESYPLLFEGSSFYYTSPIVYDVNDDGKPDVILSDYDGGIYFVGLHYDYINAKKEQQKKKERYLHKIQIPRLYVRKKWFEIRLNQTQEDDMKKRGLNPYHTYFEYGSEASVSDESKSQVIRGISDNVLGQDVEVSRGLEERKKKKKKQKRNSEGNENEEEEDSENGEGEEGEDESAEGMNTGKEEEVEEKEERRQRRRLQEEEKEKEEEMSDSKHQGGQTEEQEKGQVERMPKDNEETSDADSATREEANEIKEKSSEQREEEETIDEGDSEEPEEEEEEEEFDDRPPYDDYFARREREGEITDDLYGGDGDDIYRYRGRGYGDDMMYPPDDDYALYRSEEQNFYDDANYVRLPPHVLSTPIVVEIPDTYAPQDDPDRAQVLLLAAVSYYFDEDEYDGLVSYRRFRHNEDGGDETELERGRYVASAVVVYDITKKRWVRQDHLDLSKDYTAPQNFTIGTAPLMVDDSWMGAFALGPPTVADLDGDDKPEVIVGTSMGMVYALGAHYGYTKDGFPVQMKNAVETRILVEDVLGNTNLELLVMDVDGNVVCLDSGGNTLWHRDTVKSLPSDIRPNGKLLSSSPMTLGDVDGDGILDLVFALKVKKGSVIICAIQATTGNDLPNFPIAVDLPTTDSFAKQEEKSKLPQPLLVDLHAEQRRWIPYIRRNGTKISLPTKSDEVPEGGKIPHGGSAPGLHIVQPVKSVLYIIEGGSGCTQTVNVGSDVATMVQVDDVHGTNSLDLIVTTASGNVLTLESSFVPYHSLNVWNGGDGIRSGRANNFAHGYTSTQGIFVHDVSRHYHDIRGIYVPVTFEIFDNRPNVRDEPDRRKYRVEIRDGTSVKRVIFRKVYTEPGVYTERIYIHFGPGYYALSVQLRTTHGIIYEDIFHVGYNIHYMDAVGYLLWLPLVIAALTLALCGTSKRKVNWREMDESYGGDADDEDGESNGQLGGRGLGILGRAPPKT